MLTSACTASLLAFAPSPLEAQTTSVPFEFEDSRIFVPVSVNSTTPRWFILDSGAYPTILDANVAAALRLTVADAGTTTGAGRNSLRQGRARGVSLRVGSVALGPMDVVIGEMDSLLGPSQGRGAPGIIGSRFFIEHVVELDFGAGVMHVHDPKRWQYNGTGVVLPIKVGSGVPMLDGQLTAADGTVVPIRLLVDLGAKSTLLLAEPFIDANNLGPHFPRAVVSPLGAGVGGPTRYAFVRAPRLALGAGGAGLTVDSLLVGLSVGGTIRQSAFDGLLGAEFLRGYRVIFDYRHERLILEPRTPPVPPADFDMSGMFVLAEGPDRRTLVIRDVVEGGPAEAAGLLVGDTIVAIAGRAAAELRLSSVRQMLRAGDGREVAVEISRGGARRNVTVRLRRQV